MANKEDLEVYAMAYGKKIESNVDDELLECPKCGEKTRYNDSGFFPGMTCKNNHGIFPAVFIYEHTKKMQSNCNVKSMFISLFENKINNNGLKCFECGNVLNVGDSELSCSNGHNISFVGYLRDYLDMLEGFSKIGCICKNEIVK